jgi:hypothetical protein
LNGFKRLRGNRLRQTPAQRNAQAHNDGPQRQAPTALVRLEEKVKPGAQSQQRQHQTTRGADARDLQQITPGPAIDGPPTRKLPLADKISKRLAQPRVKIMPAPNNKPPSTAPEMLPAGPM